MIQDITPLANNINLTTLILKDNLNIDGNRNNYTGERLEALNKIGEILNRNGTISIDADKIGLFTNYKVLDLSGQNLTVLDNLEGLVQLEDLNLSNNKIKLEDSKSKEILKSMKNLKNLKLSNNSEISDISCLNELDNLQYLVIDRMS